MPGPSDKTDAPVFPGVDDDPGADSDSEDDTAASDTERNDDILAAARERFALAEEAWQDIRTQSLDDERFLSGDQWPSEIKSERARDGRPCLIVNSLPQAVQQVTNDNRQNRPAIKVHPVGFGAKEETAKIIQGLIRHIEDNSNAEIAYDTGFERAVSGGVGFWRVITAFSSPKSFDQELLIKRVRDPMSVSFDPYSQEPDGSDANWAFITEDFSGDEYRATHPGSKLSAPGADWTALGSDAPDWVKSDSARVAEYFFKEMRPETIHLLGTGEIVRNADLPSRQASTMAAGLDGRVVKSRQTMLPVVHWLKINGLEILEETIWPGSFIPIIPVYGVERMVAGKRILEGIVRHAKDPQRMRNYWKSAETEAIALAPKAPFLVAEGQFEGYKALWSSANRANHAYLPYKPTSIAGIAVPPPQRLNAEPAVQAITQAALAAADDIKQTTGVFDAGVGARSNEVSGAAIDSRKNQIQTANYHFTDNHTRSMRHTGRILVEAIPSVYDAARTARIVNDDGTQKLVTINEEHQNEAGEKVLYDLTVGQYDVTVDTGPSYATRRQESAQHMMDFAHAVPQVAANCADLIVKNMDWPGAQDLAERLRKLLPAQLQDDPKAKQIPPQIQAQLAQMNQVIQGLTQHLNEATKVIETKQLDLSHRERIEILKIQTNAEIEMAKLGSKEDMALLQAKLTEMDHRLSFLQMNQPIDAPQDFNPEGADGGNYAGIGHIGGTENLTGGESPGQPMEGKP